MKSILDPTFRYVPSVETDLKKTFSRVRREIERARAAQPASTAASATRVLMLPRAKEFAGQRP
jgi:hypothetical protein